MTIRSEFNKRVFEIELFYDVLKIIEKDNPKLTAFDISADEKNELKINPERIDIFFGQLHIYYCII